MPVDCMSCIIYQYKCDSCNAIYIGKTEQNFKCRISQHQGVSFRTGATLSRPPQSDIREHTLKHRKHINAENFTILDKLFQKSDLLLLESLHQKTKKPSIGTMTQSTPLAMFDWVYLIFLILTCIIWNFVFISDPINHMIMGTVMSEI